MTNFERDHSVRADMERVFGHPADRADDGTGGSAATLPSASPAAAKPGRNWLLLAAPLLAALFVIALAVRFALTLVPGNVAAPVTTRAARPAASAFTATAARPAPAGVAVRGGPGAPGIDVEDAEAIAPDDFGPAPVDPAPRPAAPARPVPAVDRAPADARAAAAARDCPPGSDEDRCIYQDVVGADRRLRGAYDEAVRAGVPTGELVAVRRRWDRARAISLDAPDETIRRYRQLTDRLEDLTR